MVKIVGWFLFEILWCLSDLIVKPRKMSCDKIYTAEAARKSFDEKNYHQLEKKKFTLPSDYQYSLSCELLIPQGKKDEEGASAIAVLCHGLGYSRYGCLKYAQIYLKLGFHVVIYDHRNHGRSGKALTSMGYYERYDLKKVVDWCFRTYGKNSKVITHGESMGAATVLMHLEIDQRVSCAIADCAYSDLNELLKHQLKQYYHLPAFLIPVESLLTYLRAGFWYRDVSPVRSVSTSEIPVLFVHGKMDHFVPSIMSKKMYACKIRNKAIYLVAGARHAQSCCINPKGYEEVLRKFLLKCKVL